MSKSSLATDLSCLCEIFVFFCYIWYTEQGTGRGSSPSRPLLAVPTAHPSTACVPITVLMYNGPLLCGFNVPIKGLTRPASTALRCLDIQATFLRPSGVSLVLCSTSQQLVLSVTSADRTRTRRYFVSHDQSMDSTVNTIGKCAIGRVQQQMFSGYILGPGRPTGHSRR